MTPRFIEFNDQLIGVDHIERIEKVVCQESPEKYYFYVRLSLSRFVITEIFNNSLDMIERYNQLVGMLK